MKTLLILVSVVTSLLVTNLQENKTVNATFNGAEDNVYYFTDQEDARHLFQGISEDALKKYDLNSEDFKSKKFKITYSIKTEVEESMDDSEMAEEIETYYIIDLELVE